MPPHKLIAPCKPTTSGEWTLEEVKHPAHEVAYTQVVHRGSVYSDAIRVTVFDDSEDKSVTYERKFKIFGSVVIPTSHQIVRSNLGSMPCVGDFLKKNGLKTIYDEARIRLKEIFGSDCQIRSWVYCDDYDGSQRVVVNVGVADPVESDGLFMRFCYDWWYDQIDKVGHLIDFRIGTSS